MAPIRPGRILWAVLLMGGFFLFYTYTGSTRGSFLSLPAYFSVGRDANSDSGSDTVGRGPGRVQIQEIHALLHLVVQSNGTLPTDGSVDGSEVIEYETYAKAAGQGDDFAKHALALRKTPVVVFSKSYCPYSQRAKTLLKQYNLSPAPFIVEIDHREDTQIIQNILGRLTGRRTVPNVILSTESIGGSDDLSQMHSFNKLRTVFEEKGVKVEGYGV